VPVFTSTEVGNKSVREGGGLPRGTVGRPVRAKGPSAQELADGSPLAVCGGKKGAGKAKRKAMINGPVSQIHQHFVRPADLRSARTAENGMGQNQEQANRPTICRIRTGWGGLKSEPQPVGPTQGINPSSG